MKRAWLLLIVVLAGCAPSGTGVLISILGNLGFDAIVVEALLLTGMPIRTATVDNASTLPTEFLAVLPDEDVDVTFTVSAKLNGVTVGTGTTPKVSVTARHIATVSITLGGVAPKGDMAGGGDLTVVRGGEPVKGAALTGVWGSSASDVYVTSLQQGSANLLHSSNHGATFTTSGAGASVPDLYAVTGTGTTVLLVGAQGAVLRGTGSAFTAESTPAGAKTLRGVWMSSSTDAYVVGDGNTILHGVTGGWILQTVVGSRSLNGVWGSDATHVYVVGDSGAILFSSGNGAWTEQASGTTVTLRAITGGGGLIYAVGDDGTIVRSTGNGLWTKVPSGTSNALRGVLARGTEVTVVGDAWTLVRASGGGFVALPTGLSGADRLHAVWGPIGTELFAVGEGQTILHAP